MPQYTNSIIKRMKKEIPSRVNLLISPIFRFPRFLPDHRSHREPVPAQVLPRGVGHLQAAQGRRRSGAREGLHRVGPVPGNDRQSRGRCVGVSFIL